MLGRISLSMDGQSITGLLSDKACALFGYLVVENQKQHRRSTLGHLFWPNHPDAVSRGNLRQTLHRIRQLLGDPEQGTPYLVITNQVIQFNPHSNCQVDVLELTRLLRLCQELQPGTEGWERGVSQLLEVSDLYQGQLLAGLSIPVSNDFEWWLTCKREEYQRQVIDILKCLVNYYDLQQDYRRAIQFVQQAIQLEPWSESLHYLKMSVLVHSNQRSEALQQYELCRAILADELGVEPDTETTRLYLQLKNNTYSNN